MFICTRLIELEPARHRHRHALLLDAVGRERDRLQARRAEAVDGLARGGHRQAGADGALAGDVAAGGALGVGAAHHHVLDVARIDAGALDGVGDHVAAHVGAVGEVEGAAHGSADRRAGGGYDDGVDHGVASFLCVVMIGLHPDIIPQLVSGDRGPLDPSKPRMDPRARSPG